MRKLSRNTHYKNRNRIDSGLDEAIIDLRSDAVTRPTAAMWDAMRQAELGWAPAGEDASVNALEDYAVALSGKEAALFVPTGSMANLVALMSHTRRGDQIILEASSHILWSEEWGYAYVCGVVPRAIRGVRGYMNPADIASAVCARQFLHRPVTSLICFENTHNAAGGIAFNDQQTAAIVEVAQKYRILTHLDGVRIFNASVALDQTLQQLVEAVDSVTIGLNKGLSAPGGALLCGSRKFIERSRINLKRLGGASIHQAGILAAAGLVAIETMPAQLHNDHRRAQALAQGLAGMDGLQVDLALVQTNTVLVDLDRAGIQAAIFVEELARCDVRAYPYTDEVVRFMTHRHITDADIERVLGEAEVILRSAHA